MKTKLTVRFLAGATLAFFLLALLPSAWGATTYYVTTTGSDGAAGTSWATARQTIQVAVDLTVAGDTVIVSNGVYATGGRAVYGAMTNRVAITKAITVQSVNGPGVTTLQGTGPVGNAAVRCAYVGTNATLIGFTLANGATRSTGDTSREKSGGGVWCETSGVVSNCFLRGNTANQDGGGSYGGTLNLCAFSGNSAAGNGGGGSAYGTLNQCILSTNSAESYGGGAYNGTLNNCVLAGNSTSYGGGGSFGATLNNCTLSGNHSDQYGGGSYGGFLNNCIVYFNTAPDGTNYSYGTFNFSCTTPAPAVGVGNLTSNPQFVNAAASDFHLQATSPCVDAGSNVSAVGATDLDGNPRIVHGGVDMGAYEMPSIRYVAMNGNDAADGHSWAAAKQTIQAAIDLTVTGDTVIVGDGVYATGGRVVYGAMTNRVVIDKAITVQSVNGPGVTSIQGAGPVGNAAVRCAYVGANATLIGFTLTNGATRATGNDLLERSGGGVWCETSAVVSNCFLLGNSAGGYGAGSYGGTLNNCTLAGNSVTNSGGGSYGGRLNHCTLASNSAYFGGGVSFCVLNHCTLSGNSAVYGGGSYDGTLNNCTLAGNSVTNSGGGSCRGTLNNCTLSGNSAVYGGGSYVGTLNNCIVYFNTAPTGPNYSGSALNYSCTTPAPGGPGNLSSDPQFVDAVAGNFHLLATSPCLDQGNNASVVGATDTDLDGNPRIAHGTVDMGAYEDQGPFDRYVTMSGNDAADGRSWATAKQTLQAAIDLTVTGDTVIVSNGVYATGGRVVSGYALTNRVVLTNGITLRSANGPGVTIIRGAKDPLTTNGNAAVRCAYVGPNATLIGFTLTNGATRGEDGDYDFEQDGGGVWCEPSAVVSNCFLLGNSANNYGGGSYQGTLNNCTLSGNSAHGGGGSGYGTLNQCMLSGNSADYGGGSYDGTQDNSTLTGNSAAFDGGGAFASTLNNCTLSANWATESGGGSAYGTLTNCIIYFNSAPTGTNFNGDTFDHSCTTPLPAGPGNLSSNPQFINAAAGDFHLLPSSPCIDQGNNDCFTGATDLDGNPRIVHYTVDLGAYEDQGPFDRYVTMSGNDAADGRSWATAKQTIQAAIDRTVNGDTVIVSNGVYATGGRVVYGAMTNRVVIDRAITVRSANGPGVTIIRGAKDPLTTNGNAAVRCAYVGTNATLIGFTLTNGATRAGGDSFLEQSGGGVWCAENATVVNCTLSGNSANESGGAARSGTLNYCILSGNSARYGGGSSGSDANNCALSGNSALGSGGGSLGGWLDSCTLSGNSAQYGGGVYGGTLSSCIVYFNTAPTDPNYSSSTLYYSCSTPPPGTPDNIDGDPQFVDAVTGDFHLRATSPCIDVGKNAHDVGPTDLDGNPRVVGDWVDMGALEFQVTVLIATNAPVLSGLIKLGTGNFQFNFTNGTGASFTVFASTNVALPQNAWSNLGPALETPPGSGHFQFTDPQATNHPHRYYRVRSP